MSYGIYIYHILSYHMELKSFKNAKNTRMMNMMPLKSYLPFTHVRFGGSSWCNQEALASSRNSPSAVGNPWCVPLPSSRFPPASPFFWSCFTSYHVSFTCENMSESKVHPAGCLSLDNGHFDSWKKNHRLRLRSELFELWRTLGTGGSWPHGPWCVFRRGALECCSWVVFKRSGLENV